MTDLPRIKDRRTAPGQDHPRKGDVMHCLVVSYSRTGATDLVARAVATRLGADLQQVAVARDRAGPWGFFWAGYAALRQRSEPLVSAHPGLAGYDMVVLASPVWAGKLSVPMRSFLTRHRADLPDRVALVMTSGDPVRRAAPFADFEAAVGRAPVATLHVGEKLARAGGFDDRVDAFAQELGQ